MLNRCPGASSLRTPTLKIRNCPECGAEIEIFSTERTVVCGACGFVIHNTIESCIRSCPHAKDCFGEELYLKLMGPGEQGEAGGEKD